MCKKLNFSYCSRNPVYQPIPVLKGPDQDSSNEVEDRDKDSSVYVEFVQKVEVKNHAFDSTSLKQKRGVCDFPNKKTVEQVRGTQGPRFYNKITPTQQFAKFVNISVDSMLN